MDLGFGFGFGIWILGFGSWVLGFGSWIFGLKGSKIKKINRLTHVLDFQGA
jgi:hypothetical protein